MSKRKILERAKELLKTEKGRQELERLKLDMGDGTHVSLTSDNAKQAIQERLDALEAEEKTNVEQ